MQEHAQQESIWGKLCEQVGSQVGSLMFGQRVNLLISAFSEKNNELAELKADIRKIIEEHFKTGIAYLEDAERAPTEERKRDLVNDARRKLTQASNIDAPLTAAKASLLVGVCYHLLGENENEKAWYEKAYKKAAALEQKLLEDKRERWTKRFVAATILTWGTFWLASPVTFPWFIAEGVKESNRRERVIERLKETYEFMRPLSDLLYSSGSTLEILKKSNKLVYIPPSDTDWYLGKGYNPTNR
jgi:hypothetical protein